VEPASCADAWPSAAVCRRSSGPTRPIASPRGPRPAFTLAAAAPPGLTFAWGAASSSYLRTVTRANPNSRATARCDRPSTSTLCRTDGPTLSRRYNCVVAAYISSAKRPVATASSILCVDLPVAYASVKGTAEAITGAPAPEPAPTGTSFTRTGRWRPTVVTPSPVHPTVIEAIGILRATAIGVVCASRGHSEPRPNGVGEVNAGCANLPIPATGGPRTQREHHIVVFRRVEQPHVLVLQVLGRRCPRLIRICSQTFVHPSKEILLLRRQIFAVQDSYDVLAPEGHLRVCRERREDPRAVRPRKGRKLI
jgi:hypothetical protein